MPSTSPIARTSTSRCPVRAWVRHPPCLLTGDTDRQSTFRGDRAEQSRAHLTPGFRPRPALPCTNQAQQCGSFSSLPSESISAIPPSTSQLFRVDTQAWRGETSWPGRATKGERPRSTAAIRRRVADSDPVGAGLRSWDIKADPRTSCSLVDSPNHPESHRVRCCTGELLPCPHISRQSLITLLASPYRSILPGTLIRPRPSYSLPAIVPLRIERSRRGCTTPPHQHPGRAQPSVVSTATPRCRYLASLPSRCPRITRIYKRPKLASREGPVQGRGTTAAVAPAA